MTNNDGKQLKIKSDGTWEGTQVLLDGVPLPGVASLKVSNDKSTGLFSAVIFLEKLTLDMTADKDANFVCNLCKSMERYDSTGWVE